MNDQGTTSGMDVRETILIIDDQEQNQRLLTTLLTMTGHEVNCVSGCAQAMQQLEVHTPDLILLDVLMPEMNGIEVCRLIKADARWVEIPVIFLSAEDDKNLIVEALECGGVDYVTKPFNKAELLSRVRTHLVLRRAREELRNLAEDKDEVLGMLTHDLGNHLAGILFNAIAAGKQVEKLSEPCARLIGNIVRSTEDITNFVQEFLANQSAERLCPLNAPFDLRAALHNATQRHVAMAAAKQIELKAELPGQPIATLADESAVARVLDNLVSNAIKFSPPGSTVTLSAACGPLEWNHFAVRDEGPGFTVEDQEKMFRRYGRLSARPTAGEHSTGLGLSIVKRLVEAMKGHILVKSEEGQGATITVKLPVAR